jgi:protein O-mannosyl-transferase
MQPSLKKNPARKRDRPLVETNEQRARLIRALVPALIALVTFLAFVPVLQNGFVNWDDEAFLVNNLNARGLDWQRLRWMFTTCYLGSCMPLNYVTYGLDYILWGMDPFGYHLTSLLIHSVNAVVFYFLSLRLLRLAVPPPSPPQHAYRLAAAISALLFSLHPLRVEAVAWVLGREIAIAGFFFFLTLICYLKAVEKESIGQSRWGWMGAAWIFYALSLLGKEAALTLPFAFFVLDFYPLKRLPGVWREWSGTKARQIWWEKLPFLLIALAAAIKALLAKGQSGTIYAWENYGLLPRLAQVLYSFAFYLWKTLAPIGLSPLYPLRPFAGPWSWLFLATGGIFLSLTVGLFILRRRWPAGLAAWAFYMLLLLPVSGIVAFGPYAAADRFSYIPCALWAVLPGMGLVYAWKLKISRRMSERTLAGAQVLAAATVVALAALTWHQSQVWKDSERLWRHALSIEERSSFAHNNLGLVLADRGALPQAVNEFRRAVQIDPAFLEAHTNLGNFLAQIGSREEALAHLHQALQIDPMSANARNTLGNILIDSGELEQALDQFYTAIEINPDAAIFHYNLARALAKKGDVQGAISQYRHALELDPEDDDVRNNLGLLLLTQGNLEEAIEQFRAAIRVNPKYAKAYFNLGKVNAEQGSLDEAVANFRRALQFQPEVAEIHENLADALALQGKKDEAAAHYAEALRILRSQRPRS